MHNYYLYEEDGVMTMLPWDYNLSFVAFQTSYTTEEMINFPIDEPVSGNTVEDRPMLAWIFSNEEYTELYHELFQEFIDEFFVSGYFENMVNDVETLIYDDVESDPSKFCTFEQFTTGVQALKDFVALRVESIQGQLDGTIGSTFDEQENDANLISAGDVDVTDTGSESVQKAAGNDQSPSRNQSGGQSMGGMGQMGGGMGQMMGGMSQMGDRVTGMIDNVNVDGKISEISQTFNLSDTQLLMLYSAGILALGIGVVAIYRRRIY